MSGGIEGRLEFFRKLKKSSDSVAPPFPIDELWPGLARDEVSGFPKVLSLVPFKIACLDYLVRFYNIGHQVELHCALLKYNTPTQNAHRWNYSCNKEDYQAGLGNTGNILKEWNAPSLQGQLWTTYILKTSYIYIRRIDPIGIFTICPCALLLCSPSSFGGSS